MGNSYKRLDATVQQAIREKTNGKCWYCGTDLVIFRQKLHGFPNHPRIKPDGAGFYSIDHVEPRNNGGGDNLSNLVPSCRSCNATKGTKSLEEYREWLTWHEIGRFSESQMAWLKSHGIDLPEPPEIVFYFESMNLD